MYFFYFDESGSRDPSSGTKERPKDHIYVLLAVGMYEGQWRPFEDTVSGVKLELARRLKKDGEKRLELADCQVKSSWVRIPSAREKHSPFLHKLRPDELKRLTNAYYEQVAKRKMVILASVIDKRFLHHNTTHEKLHMKAYEFLLERIQHYMRDYHPKHRALIVMDDTDEQLNRAVAMKQAQLQRMGNWNMDFPAIVEYPFFTRSELSNGVQLADQLAYNVYHAFKYENFDYPHFEKLLPNFHRRREGAVHDGLKVWPEGSPLIRKARATWRAYEQKAHWPKGG